jgi:hypothetical protein
MKIRRGNGRAQFVSFNFPNNLIWAIESTEDMQIAAGAHAAMSRPGDPHAFGVGSL